jgi:hypothetical protein
MNLRGVVVTAVVACGVGWVGGSVYSEDAPPSAAEMKEAFLKLGQPGEEHRRMKALVGEWNVLSKMTDFDGKVVETQGRASISMVLGDRYLRQEYTSTYEGKPFVGRGLMAYDNGSKRWSHSWIDSMSTGMSVGDGEETVRGKVWKFKSTFYGPGGTPMTMHSTLTLVGPDEMTMEATMEGMPQPMTLRYTRRR